MHDFFMRLVEQGYIIPLGGIAFGCTVAICSVLAGVWHKVRQAELEAALKHKMLDQGMSADDIHKVLSATMPRSSRGCGFKANSNS
jgi:hypothetical protein